MASKTEDRKWQERLLPTMTRTLIILAIFFFLGSTLQLYYLHNRIENAPGIEKSEIANPASQKMDDTTRGLLALEANLIERRYHQANTSLMNRIWLKYLGFVTGMIMAIVGSVFILGKMKEDQTELGAETEAVNFSIKSSSPGLIMVVLGTVLMMTTILSHNRIDISDTNIYLQNTKVSIATDKALDGNSENDPKPKEEPDVNDRPEF